MRIQGFYLNGRDSTSHPASLELVDQGALQLRYGGVITRLDQDELKISSRIGNTGRYVYLEENGVFETPDNNGVDALERVLKTGRKSSLVFRLESNLGWICSTAVLVLAFVVLSFTHGIPWLSGQVVHHLPDRIDQHLGQEVMTQLEDGWFAPSELPEETQARVMAAFEPYLQNYARLNPGQNLQVELRHSDTLGANAMALPSGVIIFTDALVSLAEDDDELVAILGHEIGHVVHRHSLRAIVQSSLVLWMIVTVTGDISAASEMAAAIPAMLVDLAYSRDMEAEADDYALALMHDHGLDPNHFAAIMSRLEASRKKTGTSEEENSSVAGFLSSHPPTPERVKRFQTNP